MQADAHTGHVRRLTRTDLDRFPGSLLHLAVSETETEASGADPIPIPASAPLPGLAPLITALYRQARVPVCRATPCHGQQPHAPAPHG